jgi:putative hydrolase of the HAD superfamily
MLRALFVDAAGTLLQPREPVGITYARAARELGHDADPAEVQARFRAALRAVSGCQEGDGRAYWRAVVGAALGVEDERVFEALYRHYAEPRAWWVDTEALVQLGRLARRGLRLGIVSNWDLRLRTLYNRFALDRMFPMLLCSAEVEVEKPDAAIFHLACEAAGVAPAEALHIGDDLVRDVDGAMAAGLQALHYDEEIGWPEVARRVERLRRPGPLGR